MTWSHTTCALVWYLVPSWFSLPSPRGVHSVVLFRSHLSILLQAGRASSACHQFFILLYPHFIPKPSPLLAVTVLHLMCTFWFICLLETDIIILFCGFLNKCKWYCARCFALLILFHQDHAPGVRSFWRRTYVSVPASYWGAPKPRP